MASDSDLSSELAAFEERWERITEVPESPGTLMSVIEYSLGSNRKAEEYVNRLLRYLLDLEAPHGLGPGFLEAFLEGLPASCNFREDNFDLSDVRVRDQVQIDGLQDSDRTGYVDLVVDVPAEWFLLVELKFSADEGRLSSAGLSQTEFYYEAAKLGDREKSAYESGAYYLYVHPADRPGAESPNFSNLTWSTLTEDVIDPFIAQNAPRFPQRTVGQLRELVDDLGQITGMTAEQSNRQEKVELYSSTSMPSRTSARRSTNGGTSSPTSGTPDSLIESTTTPSSGTGCSGNTRTTGRISTRRSGGEERPTSNRPGANRSTGTRSGSASSTGCNGTGTMLSATTP